MAKQKFTKEQQKANEAEENRKFLMIVVIATIVLVALMYFIFS